MSIKKLLVEAEKEASGSIDEETEDAGEENDPTPSKQPKGQQAADATSGIARKSLNSKETIDCNPVHVSPTEVWADWRLAHALGERNDDLLRVAKAHDLLIEDP